MNCVQALLAKLQSLHRKVNAENVAMVELSSVLPESGEEYRLDPSLKN